MSFGVFWVLSVCFLVSVSQTTSQKIPTWQKAYREVESSTVFSHKARNSNSQEIHAKPTDEDLEDLIPAFIRKSPTTSVKTFIAAAGDLVKLQASRLGKVSVAGMALGLAMLFKMFLLWVGPYLASAPAQAIQSAITKEASRQLLTKSVTSGISALASLYG